MSTGIIPNTFKIFFCPLRLLAYWTDFHLPVSDTQAVITSSTYFWTCMEQVLQPWPILTRFL